MTITIDREKSAFHWLVEVVDEFARYGVANIETSADEAAVAEAANVLAILPRFYQGYDIIVRLKRPSKVHAWRFSNRNKGTIALTVDHSIGYESSVDDNLLPTVVLGCECPAAEIHGKFSVSCTGVSDIATSKAVARHADLFNKLDRYLPEPKGAKFEIGYMNPPGQRFTITMPFQQHKPIKEVEKFKTFGVLEGDRQLGSEAWHAFGEALFAFAWGGWTRLGFEVVSGQKTLDDLLSKARSKDAEKIKHHLPKAIDGCYEMMHHLVVRPHEGFSRWREMFKMPEAHEGYFVSSAIHGLNDAQKIDAETLVESYNKNYARPRGIAAISAEQLKRALNINFEQHIRSKELESSVFYKTIERIQ